VDLELDDLRLRDSRAAKLLAEFLLHEAVEVRSRLPYVHHTDPVCGCTGRMGDLPVAERHSDAIANLVVLIERSVRDIDHETNSHGFSSGRIATTLRARAKIDSMDSERLVRATEMKGCTDRQGALTYTGAT
jgi:hypothetical protein